VPWLGSSIYYYYIRLEIALLDIPERSQLETYGNASNPRERRAAPAADIFKQFGKNRSLSRYPVRSII
jgi:hypothetical protein